MDEVQNPKKKVLIACPTEGLIPSETYDNHLEFMFHLGKREKELSYKFSIGTVGGVFTPLARERICDAALESGFDFVFMYDDDMILPLDTIERLLKHDLDVVAPLAFMKRPPHAPVIFMQRSGFKDGKPYFSNNIVYNYPKNRLFECDATGFGAVLIKTSILKRMHKPWFMSTCGTGEDVLFCFNAKNDANARIFVDTSVKLGHLAPRNRVIDEAVYESSNPVDNLRDVCGDYSPSKKKANLVS